MAQHELDDFDVDGGRVFNEHFDGVHEEEAGGVDLHLDQRLQNEFVLLHLVLHLHEVVDAVVVDLPVHLLHHLLQL